MSEPIDIRKRRRTPSPIGETARGIADLPLMNLIAEGVQHIGNILRAETDTKIAAAIEINKHATAGGVARVAEQVTRETDAKIAALEVRIAALEQGR